MPRREGDITRIAREKGVSRDTIRRLILDSIKDRKPVASRVRSQWIVDEKLLEELIQKKGDLDSLNIAIEKAAKSLIRAANLHLSDEQTDAFMSNILSTVKGVL